MLVASHEGLDPARIPENRSLVVDVGEIIRRNGRRHTSDSIRARILQTHVDNTARVENEPMVRIDADRACLHGPRCTGLRVDRTVVGWLALRTETRPRCLATTSSNTESESADPFRVPLKRRQSNAVVVNRRAKLWERGPHASERKVGQPKRGGTA